MLVLHAAVQGGRLAIWGETPVRTWKGDAPVGRGRRRKGSDVPRSPRWGAPHQLLRETVPLPSGEATTLIGWLPSWKGKPEPSSPIVGESLANGHAVIEPWLVDALEIDLGEAIDLLASVVGKRMLAPGVVVGA